MGKYFGQHVDTDGVPYKPRTVFIPWTSFMSIGNIALDGNAANIWITEGSGTTAGTPLIGEMGATSTDIAAVEIAAAGDLFSTIWVFPNDIDTSDPQIYFRVHFIHEATGSDTPDFKVHYLWRAVQEALLEPVANATGVTSLLDHAVSTTADTLERTAWGIAATQPASTDYAGAIAVEVDDLGSASAGEIMVIGLEIRYKPDPLDGSAPTS